MTDDYAARLYLEQQQRSQEASRQALAAIDSMRAARDQQIYWQQFYRFFDQQRDQLLEQQRLANEMLTRHSVNTDPARQESWNTSPASDSWTVMTDQQLEYSAAFQGRFSENAQLRAVWDAARQGAGSWDAARSEFWSSVNAAETAEARYVQEMLVSAGYTIRDGDKAPILRMPEYGHVADSGLRAADLILEIDHADPRTLPAGASVKGRGRRLDPADELAADNLRFMSGRDNRFRGNRYDENDQAFDSTREVRSRHREFVTRLAGDLLDHARDATDLWLYWQQFYRFFDQQREVLLESEAAAKKLAREHGDQPA